MSFSNEFHQLLWWENSEVSKKNRHKNTHKKHRLNNIHQNFGSKLFFCTPLPQTDFPRTRKKKTTTKGLKKILINNNNNHHHHHHNNDNNNNSRQQHTISPPQSSATCDSYLSCTASGNHHHRAFLAFFWRYGWGYGPVKTACGRRRKGWIFDKMNHLLCICIYTYIYICIMHVYMYIFAFWILFH